MTTTHAVRANANKTANTFRWTNLSSVDDAASAAFYTSVFGWEYNVMPIGESLVHRNATLDGQRIAGIDPVMPGSGAPTAWTNFVFVDDIDATITTATELGATVIAPSMDVMGEGHMAVLADPTGAVVGLWQPGRHTGADAVNQPGAYAWVELITSGLDAARDFYTKLFGWNWRTTETVSGGDYWIAGIDGFEFAGAMAKTPDMGEMPNAWAPYFGVADVDAAADAVRAAGGQVVYGPFDMGPGRGFGVVDPQGGYFVAYRMNEWPVD